MVQRVIRLSKVNVGLIRPCLSFSFSTELKINLELLYLIHTFVLNQTNKRNYELRKHHQRANPSFHQQIQQQRSKEG